MDGENSGSKPYEQMDDLEGFPIIFGSTPKWKKTWHHLHFLNVPLACDDLGRIFGIVTLDTFEMHKYERIILIPPWN